MQTIIFSDIPSDFVKDCFLEAAAAFPALRDRHLTLRRIRLTEHTMRAQPVLNGRFFNTEQRQYRIDISSHIRIEEHVRIPDLPRPVLMGWLAHELGHVVDYLHRSALNLTRFGILYAAHSPFRSAAEYRADQFAIDHGFSDELIACKRYILNHAHLPRRYKKRIRRYYMSPDEIEEVVQAAEAGMEPLTALRPLRNESKPKEKSGNVAHLGFARGRNEEMGNPGL